MTNRVIKWIKDFLRYPYDQAAKEVAKKFDSAPSGVSEPVWSIMKTFKEKGRWKVKIDTDLNKFDFKSYVKYTATDLKTGESYTLKSDSYLLTIVNGNLMTFPREISFYHMPTWMTKEEKYYVDEHFKKIVEGIRERFALISDRNQDRSNKQSKTNQDKERRRLMNLYCGETK